MSNLFYRMIEPRNPIPLERQRFSNRALMDMILPCVVEQLLALLIGIADTLMISYASEAAVSGVSLVNQLNNIFILVFGALASGGCVVISQYIGNRDRENAVLSASQLVLVAFLFGLVSAGILLLFGQQLFTLLFGQVEAEVAQAGLTYLRITACSFPFLAVYNGCSGLFRSRGDTRTIMVVSLWMNGINVVGNAIGIFVLRAGVAGVAIPSLLSRVFAMVVMFTLSLRQNQQVCLQWKKLLSWQGAMILRLLRIALPNSVENGLFQLSKVAVTAILALFGTTQIAAYGVAQNFWMTASLFGMSTGTVFITVTGQYMGAGDVEGADYYVRKLMRLTMLGALPWNLVSMLAAPWLLQLYSLSDETRHLVVILVVLHNLFNMTICPLGFSLSHGLRAAGDVKYTMYVAIFATVVCRVFFSWLFSIQLDMGVIGITLAMICDWAVKATLIVGRYRSGKWQHFRVI